MGKGEDVVLVCDSRFGKKPKPRHHVGKRDENREVKSAVVFFGFISLALLCSLLVFPRVIPTSLGKSEREAALEVEPFNSQVSNETDTSPSETPPTMEDVQLETKEEPITLRVREDEVEDSLNYADEVEGLKGHVGERISHPESVAFILPLRNHVGNQGIKYAKELKEILEAARQAYDSSNLTGNTSHTGISQEPQYPTILGNDSKVVPPSHILIKDSRGDFDIARQLTQHFYEEHGTTRFFGLLTDEEAMSVALWARVRAPGARFITPTAISTYLDSAPNVLRVQPSAKVLATALADLLVTMGATRPLAVVRASLHMDAFLALLRPLGIKPSQIIHYYETTKFEDLTERIRKRMTEIKQPILLLGDSESWEIVHIADSYYTGLWICPLPTQLHDHIRTVRSEVIYFTYRAHDDVPESTLKENSLLDPHNSTIKASLSLLNGKKKSWRGSYVAVAAVPPSFMRPDAKILAGIDLIPIIQYDVERKGISRKVYQELQLTSKVLRPLAAGSKCSVIIRYIQELTGRLKRTELPLEFLKSTLLIPAGRGAQLHLDCPRHHVDLRCAAPVGSWSPIKCRGVLQGIHHYQSYCGGNVGVSFSATKGCTISKGLMCANNQTLGCRLTGLCSSLSYSRMMYDCDGIPITLL